MKLEIEITAQNFPNQNLTSKKDSVEEIVRMLDGGIQAAKDGNRAEARQSLWRVTESEPENENAWLWLASVSEYPEELLAFLQHVLKINPQNNHALEWSATAQISMAETFVKHGFNALQKDEREIARQCFLRAVRHYPQDVHSWLELSFLAETQEKKMSYLQQVLSITPDNETALSAIETFKQENINALLKKANFAAISGEREQALQLLAEIEQNSPDLEEVWILKAYLAEENNEKISCYEKILQLNSDNEAAQVGLASLQAQIQKIEGQKPLAEALKEAFAENNFQFEEGDFQNADAEVKEFSSDNFLEEVVCVEDSFEELTEDFPPLNEDVLFISEPNDEYTSETDANTEPSADIQEQDELLTDFASEISDSFSENEAAASQTTALENHSPKLPDKSFACPFCYMMNEPQTIICSSCRTIISLSDLEMLLGYRSANPEILHTIIRNLEIARNNKNIDVDELVLLSIACFNTKDLRSGLYYLREAAQLKPDDTELVSKVNFLTNRISEIELQDQKPAESAMKISTIMIVDDNPTILKLVSSKLEKCGHKVIPANDGREALAKITEITPDLILLDVALPKMDGYQVCKIIRGKAETKDVPVLMISGKDGIFDESRGKIAGSTGFITKPFGPETLMRTVETYLS